MGAEAKLVVEHGSLEIGALAVLGHTPLQPLWPVPPGGPETRSEKTQPRRGGISPSLKMRGHNRRFGLCLRTLALHYVGGVRDGRIRSNSSLRSSSQGGNWRFVPRAASGSSMRKPGPSVAISKSRPDVQSGSRK